jgi:DNA polymerase
MIAVLNALPADELEPREQRIWEDTVRMNHRGLPVDEAAIKRIFAVTTWYKTKEAKRLPIITNERVKTVGQRDAILNWCEEKGVQLDNLQAATVEDALDNMPLPSDVRLVLELRQDLSKTSVSKFNSLFNQMWLQRIYDNLRYYRASTGRYGGQAFQIHNLPRAKTDDVEGTIEKFFDGTVLNLDVLYLAKALIRAMVTAEPEHILVVNDFSSIEYIILMWVAGQWDAVENFRNGRDPYKDMAALLFKCLYEEVTDEQRNLAKPVVLGAGYNLGPGGYIHYAKQYGIDINIQEATYSINTYRQSKPKVVDLWYALRNASIKAIEQVGTTFSAGRGNFKVIFDRNGTKWLRYILPSGRPLFYNDPKVIDGKYGRIASHMGVHPKTHQWVRLELSPARLTENEIQALARDVLCYTQTTLLDSKIDLLASVHDETVCQIPLDQIGIADKLIHKRHEIPPAWCHDLPLQAKMFTAKRYKKG